MRNRKGQNHSTGKDKKVTIFHLQSIQDNKDVVIEAGVKDVFGKLAVKSKEVAVNDFRSSLSKFFIIHKRLVTLNV
jgi:hypothetical protein